MSKKNKFASIIGREKEIKLLEERLLSSTAEFIALYGRRRVGKSYLIKQFFEKSDAILFEQTGINKGTLHEQLKIFAEKLGLAFYRGAQLVAPRKWMNAFKLLDKAITETPKNKQIIIIFDELPWLASRKSGFLKALEYYWNTAWTYRKKLILVVCGSAASWMLEHIVYTKGGLHNRLTARISLQPFNLSETEAFLKYRGINLNRQQILQIYMAIGGIPHYLQALQKGLSATQNISMLCFQKENMLFNEFEMLFHSLYDEPEIYIKLIEAIAGKTNGISRDELIKKSKISDGGYLNARLRSLEEAGFINSFLPVGHARRGVHFRISDEYILFYLRWIKPLHKKPSARMENQARWENIIKKPEWLNWAGYAFEAVCFKHLNKIKNALGLQNINTICSDWRYRPAIGSNSHGTQIDLIFDRDDDCVSLCEIKYNTKPYLITKEYVAQLLQKEAIYKTKTRCNKQIFWVLITANGAVNNQHLQKIFSKVLTLEHFFH